MITPPVGVNPMLVSIDLPPLTAVMLAPLPRWAMIRRSGEIVRKLAHDRFARQAVKPVALDTLRLQFLGDRKDARDLRQFGMKGGVETSHLRQPGKMLLREADDRQRRRDMQRREGGCGLKLPQDRIIDEAMLPQLRSAMHDSMPDGGRRRLFGVGKKSSNADDCFPLVWEWRLSPRATSFRANPARGICRLCSPIDFGLAGEQHFGS